MEDFTESPGEPNSGCGIKIMLNRAPGRSTEYASDTTTEFDAVVCTFDTNIRYWICCNGKYCCHLSYCNHLICYQRRHHMLIPLNP